MKNHPAADSFPMMDAARYRELVDDLREHGQREPITLCDGMILDGRNRYKACVELAITPKTRMFDGNPWSFVWSLNGQRRDLVAEQRYLIWKFCHEHGEEWQRQKRAIAEEGNRKRSETQAGVPKAEAGERARTECSRTSETPERHARAAESNTNPGAVARGDKLAKHRPDLAAAVRQGEMKPSEAHRQLKKDEVKGKAAELPSGKHAVIYADPPWQYGDQRHGEEMHGTGADSHYPTMPLSDLKALPIGDLAAENCVLFLWATCPLLEDALELCRAWGFRYKAQFVWDKVKHNMGHYNSVRHELLLICTRGSATPQNVKLHDSVQVIEKTTHSAKPELFREIIDELYPVGNRIELFRRGAAPKGWTVWGNEAS